jgi:hypothetical protein
LFGWLKKRQENELIKLVHQNFLAFSFLAAEEEAAEEEGEQISTRFSEKSEICRQLSTNFAKTKSLSGDETKMALALNREARGIYEHLRKEQNELSKMFGSRLLAPSFDDSFKPTLGWDDFYEGWKNQYWNAK